MLGQKRVDHVVAEGFERGKGAALVRLHPAGIADHIGGNDRCEPTLDVRDRYRSLSLG